MIKVLIGIQARTASTRFPNKVLAELCGKPVIEHVYERCLEAAKYKPKVYEMRVVLLIPGIDRGGEIDKWLSSYHYRNNLTYSDGTFPCIPGDEEDLINRYDEAIHIEQPDLIIRVTGDCPLIPPRVITACIDMLGTTDYASNTCVRTYYDGWDVQGCSSDAWNTFFKHQKTYREHPFREFDMNETVRDEFEAKGFKWGQLINSNCSNQVKLSVDTPEDLETCRRFLENTKRD